MALCQSRWLTATDDPARMPMASTHSIIPLLCCLLLDSSQITDGVSQDRDCGHSCPQIGHGHKIQVPFLALPSMLDLTTDKFPLLPLLAD